MQINLTTQNNPKINHDQKIIARIIVALPATVFAQKFGTVNADAILQAMPEVTAMQTTISEASKKYEDEFSKLQEEMQKKITEYQTLEKTPPLPMPLKNVVCKTSRNSTTKSSSSATPHLWTSSVSSSSSWLPSNKK